MKVLIADDSRIVRQRLVTMISEIEGISVIGEAQDSGGAIESIMRLHPDAVVLDIRMPGGGGFHVIREIKNNGSTPTIIVLTNYPYPQYRRKCAELGVPFFFDKSIEFEKVTEVLEQLKTA